MARKIKASNLSVEERLEQTLIPLEDKPYELPENWCWINLKSVLRHQSGNSKIIKGRLSIEKRTGLYDAYSASGQDVYTETYEHEGNAIIVSAVGARCGKAFLASGKWSAIANTHIIYPNEKLIDVHYLYYILNDESWWIKSGSAQPFVVVNESLMRPFALPPLTEQKRIVDRIESLFTRLDEAKAKAQEVVDGFETRRSAILYKAFVGELTATWRVNRDVSDFWETKKLSDVAQLQTGLMKGKKFSSDTVSMPYLRVANVQDGYLDLNEIKTIEVAVANYEKYLLRKGDVLFTEGGDYDKLGRGTVWNDEIPNCLHQNHIFVVRVDTNCLMPDFLSYQAGSQYGKKYFMSCAKQTTNLASINSTQLKNFPVMLPTLDEQQEIVRILNIVLAQEKQAKEAAEAVLEQIDRQKKTILALAFRGELGTNDPSDESTVELLKRII